MNDIEREVERIRERASRTFYEPVSSLMGDLGALLKAYDAALRERDALRAGVEAVIAQCSYCGATGAVDSGGATPWGAWINVPCPDCSSLRGLLAPAVRS